MIPAANRYTVVLDANVLFPQWKRDILLRFHEIDLYRARWSETIQQEWLARARARYPDHTERLQRTDALMRQHFADAWVAFEDYEAFLQIVQLPDADDHHVAAAAVACNASYIVTDNISDFPEDEMRRFGLEVGTADQFLLGTFDHYQHRALSDLRAHRRSLRSAPSPAEYLMHLRGKGMPRLAARLQEFRDYL